MYRYNRVAKVAAPPFTSTRLLDQVRERIRYLHYSQATEKAYLFWLRAFIRWSGLRHPRDMGKPEVEAFLSMLANERHVSSSTHKQALSAILFLYREVLILPLYSRTRSIRNVSQVPGMEPREFVRLDAA